MSTPFTKGRSSEGPKSFKGTGGHTSGPANLPDGATPGSTSDQNTRGNVAKGKRMHGASGTKGYPK